MAFAFIVAITIDHTQCGSANSTDFPVCIRGTYAGAGSDPDLRVTGSGGDVTQSDGDDINFFSDAGATSLLKWEIERYTPTTGEIVAWVKVPTLDHSTDTVIYMGYGDSGITTFQGDVNGTWNSAFKGVYHFPDGTTFSANDSTSNARNGSITGTIAADVGSAGGCGNPSTAADNYVTVSDTGLPSGNNDRTITIWWNNPASFADGYLWSLGNFATGNQCFSCSVRDAGANLMCYDGSIRNGAFTFSHGVWYHLTVTWSSSSGGELFVNGVSKGTWTNGSQNTTLIGSFYIFETNPAVYNGKTFSKLDECRISNVVRTPSWLLSEYNCQKTGSNFFTFGTPTPPTGGIPPIVHHLKQQGIM